MAPFTPFLSEHLYQNLRAGLAEKEREQSIHFLPFPTAVSSLRNDKIEEAVSRMQAVIELGRTARSDSKVALKQPLAQVLVLHSDPKALDSVRELESYVLAELNVKAVKFSSDMTVCSTKLIPLDRELGKRLGAKREAVCKAIAALTPEQISELVTNGELTVAGEKVFKTDVVEQRAPTGDLTGRAVKWDKEFVVLLDTALTPELIEEGLAREVINRAQKLRKLAGLRPSDPVDAYFETDDKSTAVLLRQNPFVRAQTGMLLFPHSLLPPTQPVVTASYTIGDVQVTLRLMMRHVGVSEAAVVALLGEQPALLPKSAQSPAAFARCVHNALVNRPLAALQAELQPLGADGTFQLRLDGVVLPLRVGKHLFATPLDVLLAGGQQ